MSRAVHDTARPHGTVFRALMLAAALLALAVRAARRADVPKLSYQKFTGPAVLYRSPPVFAVR